MIKIVKYKTVEKKKENQVLVAQFDFKSDEADYIIRECMYFNKGGNRWVGYPSRTYKIDEETKYFSYIFFDDPEKNKIFQMQLLSAIDSYLETQLPKKDDLPF
jgi:hypothetical protein